MIPDNDAIIQHTLVAQKSLGMMTFRSLWIKRFYPHLISIKIKHNIYFENSEIKVKFRLGQIDCYAYIP